MRILSQILLVSTCLTLQACASSINTQRLQGGKVSFMAGDFKSAFHQLLPLAAEGIPQAEYGVGYMYYYGYGVTQDSESGVFWMNKAATAHYEPAIRALAAIQEDTLKQEQAHHYSTQTTPPRFNTTQADNTTPEKDAALEALNSTPPPNQGYVTIMPETEKPPSTKIKATALATVNHSSSPSDSPPKKYTFQLLGSYYLSSLKQRQAELNLGAPTYIGQTKHNGRDWYVLTYGQYPALGHAELAKMDLPSKIKSFKPWIRKCDELRWVG